MVLWLVLVALAAYGVVAGVTAHVLIARARAGFVADRSGSRAEWAERRFEEQERPQAEALALVSGLFWVVAVPVLVLRRVVSDMVFGRSGPTVAAPSPPTVGDRIEELERLLDLGEHESGTTAGDPPTPQ